MPTPSAGIVVLDLSRRESGRPTHELDVLTHIAQSLAQLKRYRVDGHDVPSARDSGHVFLVRDDTRVAPDAHQLGIQSAADLLPFGFVATKAITHRLVDEDAGSLPPGWSVRGRLEHAPEAAND